ncbi:MAG: hypothetical protein DMF75_18355 [Acidobacteria bacterium]|nr:MAG: hypothetical protein DMF75_18355 [Acidobacteriota bacterium]
MKKATKRLLGGIALSAGALGAIGAVLMRNNTGSRRQRRREKSRVADMWARPGMKVVFRAELMPGREASERTFRIDSLLPSGRVLLEGVTGEHARREFEPIR